MNSVEPLVVPPGALTAAPLLHLAVPFISETPRTSLMDRKECMCLISISSECDSPLISTLALGYRQKDCTNYCPC